jgi:hypothetical protein
VDGILIRRALSQSAASFHFFRLTINIDTRYHNHNVTCLSLYGIQYTLIYHDLPLCKSVDNVGAEVDLGRTYLLHMTQYLGGVYTVQCVPGSTAPSFVFLYPPAFLTLPIKLPMTPRLSIFYWVFGTECTDVFKIEVAGDKNLTDVRKLISKKHTQFFVGISQGNLRRWNLRCVPCVSGYCTQPQIGPR